MNASVITPSARRSGADPSPAISASSAMNATLSKLKRNVNLALRSLWLHQLRTALSVLGIIIGNVAVIILVAFGEGTKREALEQINKLGPTNIVVRSVKPPDSAASAGGPRGFVSAYGLSQ